MHGAGGAASLYPDAQLGIGPPIRRRLLLRLRRRDARSCPRTSSKIETADAQDHQGGPAVLRGGWSPTPTRSTELPGRALQGRADRLAARARGPTPRRSKVPRPRWAARRADHLRQRRAATARWPGSDLCRGPHLPTTKRIPAFKLMRNRGGVLARRARRTSSCSASTAPPGRPGGAAGRTCTGSRRPSGATTASSGASSTCSPSPTSSAPACAVFHPKGGVIRRVMEDYVAAAAHRGGLLLRQHARTSPRRGLFETSGPPAVLRRRPCSRRWSSRARTTTSRPMNCPMHNLIYRVARSVLPRAAAAAVRVRQRLPVREVRRRARADPGPRLTHGRLAHPTCTPRAGARTRSSTC